MSITGVSFGGILFLLTSFSDPGVVTAENVCQYVSAYPYDNIIYVQKLCSTCNIPKLVNFLSFSTILFLLNQNFMLSVNSVPMD